MAAVLVDLGLATTGLAERDRARSRSPSSSQSALGLRLAFDLFVFSAAAGLFVVPIFAAIQAWAGEDRRARVVGAVNALNYLMMVAGSIVTMILLQVVGMSEPTALVVLGLANVVAAVYVFRNLPANTLRLRRAHRCCVSSTGSKWSARRICRVRASARRSRSTTSRSSTRRR